MSIVPGPVFTVFYRVFREICVDLNIHENKFLTQDAYVWSLFKTAKLFYSDEFNVRCIPDTCCFIAQLLHWVSSKTHKPSMQRVSG